MGKRRLGQGSRSLDGHEIPLPTWTAAQAEHWLGRAQKPPAR
jgi:hypothetical protein